MNFTVWFPLVFKVVPPWESHSTNLTERVRTKTISVESYNVILNTHTHTHTHTVLDIKAGYIHVHVYSNKIIYVITGSPKPHPLATPFTTYLAGEALRVPLSIDGSNEALHDGLVTPTTARSKLLIVALAAKGLAVFLVETLRTKVLATQRAEKVLGMPRPV